MNTNTTALRNHAIALATKALAREVAGLPRDESYTDACMACLVALKAENPSMELPKVEMPKPATVHVTIVKEVPKTQKMPKWNKDSFDPAVWAFLQSIAHG